MKIEGNLVIDYQYTCELTDMLDNAVYGNMNKVGPIIWGHYLKITEDCKSDKYIPIWVPGFMVGGIYLNDELTIDCIILSINNGITRYPLDMGYRLTEKFKGQSIELK